jgi:two-component system cell cycle response regulator CtrA
MRILQIEDDEITRRAADLMLTAEGFNVESTDLGEEGLELAMLYAYDLVLLDLDLPDMNGADVLRRMRLNKIKAPVLILTGCADIDTKVKMLSAGADDYMTKPFHKDELVARIRAVVRRTNGHETSRLTFGPLVVDLDKHGAFVDDKRLHLTGKEYDLLELLAVRKGQTVTKELAMSHLYGGRDEPEMKIVDVFICKLRRKLVEATMGVQMIETIWGTGYALRAPAPVEVAAQ